MPVRSGGGCVKYLISAGPSLCVRQWMAANSLIRSLSSPRRDIPCPSVRLLPVRLRAQLCRPHFRTALLPFPAYCTVHLYLPPPSNLLHALRVHLMLLPLSFTVSSPPALDVPVLRSPFSYHSTFNYVYH